jgi:hypothetical protein
MPRQPWSDRATAADAVARPETAAADLAAIVQAHPDLGVDVAFHPNAYPGLLDWMAEHGRPAVQDAVRHRRAGEPATPTRPDEFAPVLESVSAGSAPGSAPGSGSPAARPLVFGPVAVPAPPRRKRGFARGGVLVGVAVVLVAGGAVFAFRDELFGGSDEPAPAQTESAQTESARTPPVGAPTSQAPSPAVSPSARPSPSPSQAVVWTSRVTASSVHDPEIETDTGRSFAYDPANMSDGSRDTVWFEGAAGSGSGEWVEFTFDQAETVAALYIEGGYWRSAQRLAENARPSRLRVSFDDGHEDFLVLDPAAAGFMRTDGIDGQKLTFAAPHVTRSVRLTVLAVYDGSLWDDLGITDVLFVVDR